ncbi:MAG: hypothetical protein LUE98_20520 [Tannerellaceae bacterium]|nr:hypothetical protein [Tannerellaceae bacterium]
MPPRSAEIHLRVGRLIDFIVTVTQNPNREIELHIEDLDGNPLEELIFYDFYGNDQPYEQKAFRVRWAPYGTDQQGVPFKCEVSTTLVGDDYFDFKAGTERITTGVLTDPTGRKEYTIEPEPFTEEEVSELFGNPFLQHASWVTFTVTDPADNTKSISKTIYLNHQHIAIISRNFRRLSYLDRTYEFDVLANTPFIVESIDNTENAFASSTNPGFTGGNNIVTGTRLTYTTHPATPGTYINGVGRAGRKATFYLRDQRGLIQEPVPFMVSAITDDPNTYLVNPPASGTHTLRIPIRKLFWIREREAGDTSMEDIIQQNIALEPATLRAECYNPANLGTPLQNYQVNLSIERDPAGTSALEDVLNVEIPIPAGGLSGNIIVGVKRPGASTWLWTWHIWVTDFNPDTRTADRLETEDAYFMKRNLGALTDAHLLNPTTTGFYYQWGRKDPLHPDHIPNNRQAVPAGTVSNLLNAIDNPAIYYTSQSGFRDWYTGMQREPYQNNFLWNDYEDNKTPFDPCPAGWRVPFFSE